MPQEFRFNLKIQAVNETEAQKVAQLLNAIYKNCSNSELMEAADQVKEDPGIIRKLIQVASNKAVRTVVSKFLK